MANHLESDPDKARAKLAAARQMVEHSLVEARESLIGLRIPGGAETLNFPEATFITARTRCEEANVLFRAETLDGEAAETLPAETAYAFHRIILEAVTNSLRHSGAANISATYEASATLTRIVISDDGEGFSTSQAAPEGHFGIQGMRERAQQLGASFVIHSGPQIGTSIELSLPNT